MRLRIKKKKILFFVLVFAVAGFLLLPVIDGALSKVPAYASAKKAVPQAASSNPLTKAMEFLSSIIKGRKKETASAPEKTLRTFTGGQRAALNITQYDERAGVYQGIHDGKEIRIKLDGDGISEIKDKDGNWIMVHQKEPDVFSRGMYDYNLKNDPLSIMEGRRISNQIAADNKDANGFYASALPFSKIFSDGARKGINAISNTFENPDTILQEGKEYYAALGNPSGNISGFSRGNVSMPSEGYSGQELSEIFAKAQQKAFDSLAMYDQNGKLLSDSDKEKAKDNEMRDTQRQARGTAFLELQKQAREKLQTAAQKEIEKGPDSWMLDKIGEYDSIAKEKMQTGRLSCEAEEKAACGSYKQINSKDVYNKGKENAAKVLGAWIPGFNDDKVFSPEERESIIYSYLSGSEHSYKGVNWNALRPSFLVAVPANPKGLDLTKEQQKELGISDNTMVKIKKECQDGGCSWLAFSYTGGQYSQMGERLGWSYSNVPNKVPRIYSSVDSDWDLVKTSDLEKEIQKVSSVKPSDENFVIPPYIVTSARQGVEWDKKRVSYPSLIFQFDKGSHLDRSIVGEVVEGNPPVERASDELFNDYLARNQEFADKTEESIKKIIESKRNNTPKNSVAKAIMDIKKAVSEKSKNKE
ncbi:hypothetical protein Emin_0294 [Elusimicrobium minutum Pei191]|uniref:Uncharacterized protein n=1 Tax=Elusimicrobium minutum (strain Pei191) TaxID=445932 RepID=B2KBV0_ELUMP|nr:hypothetical protein [Elusimicrobium minutum]ACC97854.1 hypothetical protein Emin_0294 [Elusimicrobium minutum Pei191]